MTFYLSRNQSLALPGECIRKFPFPKELFSLSRRLDTTCTSVSLRPHRFPGVALTPLFHDRNEGLWGPDAREFRPERWFKINEQVESPVGVYGNLYGHRSVPCYFALISHPFSSTFSGGVRGCLGWRFACVGHLSRHSISQGAENRLLGSVIEIQAFLVTLLQKFNVSHADHQPQIRRARAGMEAPMVLGEEYKGTQLPLKITAIRDG